jgi:ubiquinone/menaquinone biosynthesis C-methylase UbiE
VTDSVSFDRAADFYDETRHVGDRALIDSIDHITSSLAGAGRVLEIGVGTGMLAVPLAERGLDVVGIDVSRAMLAKLRQKTTGATPHVALADARQLPFADDSFDAAYLRHVLHLIPRWSSAVSELCRVVRPGGVVLVSDTPRTERWEEFWQTYEAIVGTAADPVGLDMDRDGHQALDDAFRAAGAGPEDLTPFTYPATDTWSEVIDAMERRTASWTWRVPDDRMDEAVGVAREWVLEQYGALDAPTADTFEIDWYRYRVTEQGSVGTI